MIQLLAAGDSVLILAMYAFRLPTSTNTVSVENVTMKTTKEMMEFMDHQYVVLVQYAYDILIPNIITG